MARAQGAFCLFVSACDTEAREGSGEGVLGEREREKHGGGSLVLGDKGREREKQKGLGNDGLATGGSESSAGEPPESETRQ